MAVPGQILLNELIERQELADANGRGGIVALEVDNDMLYELLGLEQYRSYDLSVPDPIPGRAGTLMGIAVYLRDDPNVTARLLDVRMLRERNPIASRSSEQAMYDLLSMLKNRRRTLQREGRDSEPLAAAVGEVTARALMQAALWSATAPPAPRLGEGLIGRVLGCSVYFDPDTEDMRMIEDADELAYRARQGGVAIGREVQVWTDID